MSSANRDPNTLYPEFKEKVLTIVDEVDAYCLKHAPEFKPVFGEGFRPTARQKELYAQGRTTAGPIVTKLDGVRTKSGHQTSLAHDLWFKRKGSIVFEGIPEHVWKYYGHCVRAKGLVWGGDWDSDGKSSDEKFVDYPHCEWPRSEIAVYKLAAAWQKANGLV